jgi:predicted nucleic acid-binding Zn ribbon protein
MRYCATCGEPYPDDGRPCPRCEAAERRQKATIRWWLSLALIAFVVVVLWVWLASAGDQPASGPGITPTPIVARP